MQVSPPSSSVGRVPECGQFCRGVNPLHPPHKPCACWEQPTPLAQRANRAAANPLQNGQQSTAKRVFCHLAQAARLILPALRQVSVKARGSARRYGAPRWWRGVREERPPLRIGGTSWPPQNLWEDEPACVVCPLGADPESALPQSGDLHQSCAHIGFLSVRLKEMQHSS